EPWSTDENFWGRSAEGGPLDDPNFEPPAAVFKMAVWPELAPDKPEYLTIGFTKGIPTSLDGAELPLHEIIAQVNKIAGRNGVGIIDHMEDRIIGLKSREIYECPAALTIIDAHHDLEKYVSTIHQN